MCVSVCVCVCVCLCVCVCVCTWTGGLVPAGHDAALKSFLAEVDEAAHIDELLDDAISNREMNSVTNYKDMENWIYIHFFDGIDN